MTNISGQETAWTVGRLLDWTTDWFNGKQVEGGRLAAELLLARAMNCRKIELYTRYGSEPTEEQRAAFRDLVRQAGEHAPIAYLLGEREFFSLSFEVNPAVLVPRPETEALVQCALDVCRRDADRQWHVLDIGTGSGCVAVAIAKYASNASVLATDISADALAVAARNADRHGVRGRLVLLEADGLDLPSEGVPEGGFDIIVSNPPYISESVYGTLAPDVRDHEPRTALVPEGADGLSMYRRFAAGGRDVLASKGVLLVEIAHDQADAVRGIFAAAGGWMATGSHRDPTDPHERVLEFRPQ